MTRITYAANLKATKFPLLRSMQGRTAVSIKSEHTYVPGFSPQDSSATNVKIPELLYCHNVMPTDTGYQSVGYNNYVSTVTDANDFEHVVLVVSGTSRAHVAITTSGRLFVLEQGNTVWEEKFIGDLELPVDLTGKRMTASLVSGETYIYFQHTGAYIYDFTSHEFVEVILNGLTYSEIDGIVGAYGYLIAYGGQDMVWSSTVDPTDFIPSLTTGAGGGSVEGLLGHIVAVVEVFGGFAIFTPLNAIAATYSDNPEYPFSFAPIPGCGGVTNYKAVSDKSNANVVYAYTSAGFQKITLRKAETKLPDVTDYLSGKTFEDYNDTTDTYTSYSPTLTIPKALTFISDRYLVVSYGIAGSEYSHALVYDTVREQLGKLKIAHVDCFEFALYTGEQIEVARSSIAFLTRTGLVSIVDFTGGDGVAVFGKYQLTRRELITITEIETEGTADAEVYTIASYDGNTLQPRTQCYKVTGKEQYLMDVTGKNVSILFSGRFSISSLLIHAFNAGNM